VKEMKNEKMKWYFLIAAALIVGAMVGYFATNSLSTTGNAKTIISASKTNGISASIFGSDQKAQIAGTSRAMKNAGVDVSESDIEKCINSDLKDCSELTIKGIAVGRDCICNKSCFHNVSSCGNCPGSCSAVCTLGPNTWTVTGSCTNAVYITIGGLTIYI